MEILLKTGYAKISHNILFQPETIPKGRKLVEANHVCNVVEQRRNQQSYLIRSQVMRQASVSLKPYCTTLNIDSDRKVTAVSCTCVYNKSGRCKHVAALIYYINNEESLSKTDAEQQWGKPTTHQLTKEKYAKGKFFWEMYPPTKTSSGIVNARPLDICELKDSSPLKAVLQEGKKEKNEKIVKNLMGCVLNQVEIILLKEDCTSCVNTFFTLCEKQIVYMKQQLMDKSLKLFFDTSILVSQDEIIQLCCDTIDQSKCDQWFQARSIRLSASTHVHAIKIRSRKPIEKIVSEMLTPRKVDTPAVRYGTKYEVDAMKKYEKLFSVYVKKIGLLISTKQPWLCASLDGVVTENGRVKKIVEFKCPITCEKVPVVDFQAQKCNLKYLVYDKKEVHLKASSQYYTQCQTQMYVSGVNTCDLFIYSPVVNGCCCIIVQRNEDFLKEVIPICEDFYFQHLLPRLMEKTKQYNQIQTAVTNKSKQSKRCFTGVDISNEMETLS